MCVYLSNIYIYISLSLSIYIYIYIGLTPRDASPTFLSSIFEGAGGLRADARRAGSATPRCPSPPLARYSLRNRGCGTGALGIVEMCLGLMRKLVLRDR